MNLILMEAVKKYLKDTGFTKEAEDPNYICKFIHSLKSSEKFRDKYECEFLKLAADPSWTDIATTGILSALPGAAFGYLSSNEAEDPMQKALQYGAITGLGGAGVKAGVPGKLQEMYEGLDPEWKSTLKGTAIGALPAGAIGYLTAGEEESPWHKALQYGTIGGGAGAVGGYTWDKLMEEPKKKLVSNEEYDKYNIESTSPNKITKLEFENIKDDQLTQRYDAKTKLKSAELLKEYGFNPQNYGEKYGRDFVKDVGEYEKDFSTVGTNIPPDILLDVKKEGFKKYIRPNIVDASTGKVMSTGKDLFGLYIKDPIKYIDLQNNVTNAHISDAYLASSWLVDYPDINDKNKYDNFISKINSVAPRKAAHLLNSNGIFQFLSTTGNDVQVSLGNYFERQSGPPPSSDFKININDPKFGNTTMYTNFSNDFNRAFNSTKNIVTPEFKSYVNKLMPGLD